MDDTQGSYATVSTMPELADLLRDLRRRQARRAGHPPLTYRQLAARTGWSHGIIGEYLSGRVLPPTDRFDDLVRLLGATPAEQVALASARDRVEEQRTASPAAGGDHARERPRGIPGVAPRQLPADLTTFAGRDWQLALLDQLTKQRRPIVLSGTAGVGKTALAVHWAHQVAPLFPDGQLFLDLRGFGPSSRDPVAPFDALGVALGLLGVPPAQVPAEPSARAGLYRGLLSDKQMLLVLDNAATPEQVRPLLPGGGASLALVTSRVALPALVTADGARPVTLDLLDTGDAHTLLAGRIGEARTAREPEAVADIITACARLPLALSVVAARAALHPDFSLAAIAAELTSAHSRLDALHSDDPKADVETVFSWSYQRLTPPAQRLFRLGGLHPSPELGIPTAAALADLSVPAVRPLLDELVRAQLIIEPRPGRFGMHDLLCAYAYGLAHDDEPAPARAAARHRLIEHYTRSATTAAMILNPSRHPAGLHLDQPATGTDVSAPRPGPAARAVHNRPAPPVSKAIPARLSAAESGPTPSALQPGSTPSALQPGPAPSALQPGPTPSALQPGPAPSALQPGPTPPIAQSGAAPVLQAGPALSAGRPDLAASAAPGRPAPPGPQSISAVLNPAESVPAPAASQISPSATQPGPASSTVGGRPVLPAPQAIPPQRNQSESGPASSTARHGPASSTVGGRPVLPASQAIPPQRGQSESGPASSTTQPGPASSTVGGRPVLPAPQAIPPQRNQSESGPHGPASSTVGSRPALPAPQAIAPQLSPAESGPASFSTQHRPASSVSRVEPTSGAASADPGASTQGVGDLDGVPADESAAAEWFATHRRALIGAVQLAVACGFDREAWRLAWAIADHLDRGGHWGDWIATQRSAVGAAERLGDTAALALAHRSLSSGYIRSGRHVEARRHLQVAFDLFVELADHAGAARCQHALAWLLETQDRFAEAVAHDERALDLFRLADDPVGQARALNSAGWHHARLGHHELALECCEDALVLQRGLGDAAGVAATLDSLGYVHHRLGEHDQAIERFQEALLLYAEQGDRFNEADTSIRLGDTWAAAGRREMARGAWLRSVETLDRLAHPKAAEVRTRLKDLDTPTVDELRWPVTT